MNRSAHLSLALFSALLAVTCAVVFAVPASAPADENAPADPVAGQPTTVLDDGSTAVAGEVLVGYDGSSAPQTVPIPDSADPDAVAGKIEDSAGVRYAIPNYVASASGWLPNDNGKNPRKKGKWGGWRSKQWNFLPCLSYCHSSLPSDRPQSRGGINVVRAWQNMRQAGRAGAAGVKIAVIDSGIAYRKYGRRFHRAPDVAAGRFLPGYDFVDHDRIPLDLFGHGTHVSMTIGEQTDNHRGLTGIAYRSKLMPVRVLDANGDGDTADIVDGINWATNHGARVMVMSLNFTCGLEVPPLEEALKRAWRKGVVMVGSSGNIGAETCPSLPATSPEVISVGGTTESGCVASYSFQSPAIDIAAPGGGQDRASCPWESRNRPILQLAMVANDPSWFAIEPRWVGTSMAAAHVAGGAAAVIASGVLGKEAGPAKVAERLEQTARLPAYAEGDSSSGFGAGIVDLGRATNPDVRTD
ncbi:MAG: S8 family serine peptidase [Solirubrobacterales bacterium]|nr:S8 family serine peptidase [Solirubrobacterales bacterium]MCB8914718.1 S8 family serine peptidase [Thermoleophilales bacterium]